MMSTTSYRYRLRLAIEPAYHRARRLRGAPNRELAIAFIEFCLSKPGQELWNNKLGTKNGPLRYALRRLPIRKDMYTDVYRKNMIDSDEDPYKQAVSFEYRGALTGPYFGLIRNFIKAMIIIPVDDLKTAWKAIIDAGGPKAVPQAYAAFTKLPFAYAEAKEARNSLGGGVLQSHQIIKGWARFFAENYKEATRLAKESK